MYIVLTSSLLMQSTKTTRAIKKYDSQLGPLAMFMFVFVVSFVASLVASLVVSFVVSAKPLPQLSMLCFASALGHCHWSDWTWESLHELVNFPCCIIARHSMHTHNVPLLLYLSQASNCSNQALTPANTKGANNSCCHCSCPCGGFSCSCGGSSVDSRDHTHPPFHAPSSSLGQCPREAEEATERGKQLRIGSTRIPNTYQ